MKTDLVVAGYIIHDDKVLLIHHKKLNLWLPVGGHIEPGETPEDAILREVQEEVGCAFEFHPKAEEKNNGQVRILKPTRMQVEKVPHHGHHINTIFFGKVMIWSNAVETDEQEKLRWFSEKELQTENILESVCSSALDALKNVK